MNNREQYNLKELGIRTFFETNMVVINGKLKNQTLWCFIIQYQIDENKRLGRQWIKMSQMFSREGKK